MLVNNFEELYQQNLELDAKLKALRKQEELARIELRIAMDNLNNIQNSIETVDQEFEQNCANLQDLNNK